MPYRFENINFKRTFESLPKDVVALLQRREYKHNERDFAALCGSLKHNKCYLCGQSLEYNDVSTPCFHFLLNPRLKKKYREALFSKPVSFIKLYTYLAWVANSNQPFENVNDIISDILPSRIFETTIRYKNIEWSFSFKKSDLEGHPDAKIGRLPHYHFQMTVDGNTIVNYNNCHIQFASEDFLYFEMIRQKAAKVDSQFVAGLELLKNSVQVNILSDGGVEFIEFISEDELHRTYVLKDTITHDQINEIEELVSVSTIEVYQIIDKLNMEKGYNIKYGVLSSKRNNPVVKARRD